MMRNVEYLEDFFRPYFLTFLFILVSARSTLHCGHAPHVLTRTSTGLFLKIRGCGGPAVGFDPRHMHLSLERRTWAVALGQCNLKGKNVLLYTHLKKYLHIGIKKYYFYKKINEYIFVQIKPKKG